MSMLLRGAGAVLLCLPAAPAGAGLCRRLPRSYQANRPLQQDESMNFLELTPSRAEHSPHTAIAAN